MRVFLYFSWLILFSNAYAELTITVTGNPTEGGRGQPIAIVPFAYAGSLPEDIAKIVSDDLYRSGYFNPMPRVSLPEKPSVPNQINFPTWQAQNVPHLVIGRINGNAGQYTITFELFDVRTQARLTGFSYKAPANALRQVAHQISDVIYKTLTGTRGVFSTQIVYVTLQRQRGADIYNLYIADADGASPRLMLRSSEPIFSPTWSPDGSRIAYVTYDITWSPNRRKLKQMAVYIQDIRSGQRNRVAAWSGINSAPAWSADGSRLALSLSKDGNPEIYVLDLRSGRLTRLTNNSAIDTEPEWSPDGNSLVFTSDRSGSPQIYQIAASGGGEKRLTFQGNYNARARFSPDGTKLALLHGQSGYRIAILNLSNQQMNILTRTSLDESPSFAPNGSMIIYGTGSGLAAVSVDGGVQQRISVNLNEEVREPAWSPFLN